MRSRLAIFLAVLVAASTAVLFIEQPLSAQTNTGNVARISLEINGQSVADFIGVDGLSSQINSRPRSTSKVVGAATVTLRRPVDRNKFLWEWQDAARTDPRSAPTSADVVFYDTSNSAVARFQLTQPWPSKLEIPGFAAGTDQVLMETVTIVCEHIGRVDP